MIKVQRNQEMGVCVKEDSRCKNDSECRSLYWEGSLCVVDEGKCKIRQWCGSETEVHYIKDYSRVEVIMNSYLPSDSGILSSLNNDPDDLENAGKQVSYPSANANQFQVHDLLSIAGITNFTSISYNGAILSAQLNWNCDEYRCTQGIQVIRMDETLQSSGKGFKTEKIEWQGINKRTLIEAQGIKIFAKASGSVQELSLYNIVLQLSSAIGLLLAARSLTDFIMLKVFNEKNHYANMKFIKTELL